MAWYVSAHLCERLSFLIVPGDAAVGRGPAREASLLPCGRSVLSPTTSRSGPLRLRADNYTPVIGAADHLYNNSIGQCVETRYICSAQITPPARTLLDVSTGFYP